MGARNADRGKRAVEKILKDHPEVEDRVELLMLDVTEDDSVGAAAEELRSKNIELYGLVNNAGIGLNTSDGNRDVLLNTNFYGVKRVSEAFVNLID